MAEPPGRRLIVNADDFGRSSAINEAVIRAHTEGILMTASLMVNEPAAAEAVALAKQHPRLGVGLHLVLADGRSAGSALAGEDGRLPANPVRAGLRYFFRRELRAALRAELDAQFAAFARTGLPLDHVNGHLNLHLHPVVFRLLMENAPAWGVNRVRLTRDRFWLNARLAGGAWGYRTSHAVIFNLLCRRSRPVLRRAGVRHTRHVFGLLQNARVDEAYVLRLLAALPTGDSELYAHPSLTDFRHELAAFTSPRVRARLAEGRIELIRYQDL